MVKLRASACILTLVLALVPCGPRRALANGATRTKPAADQLLEAFEIARDGDFVIIPVQVGGSKLQFIVDTGASSTFIDESHRDLLGEPAGLFLDQTQPPSGPIRLVAAFTASTILVGRLEFPLILAQKPDFNGLMGFKRYQFEGVPIMTADFNHLSPTLGHSVDGVLGMDFLKQFVVQFDLDRGQLRFLSSVPVGAGERFDLVSKRGEPPSVELDASGRKSRSLLLDTGNTSRVMLSERAFSALCRAGKATIYARSNATSLFGPVKSSLGVVDEFALGSYTHQNLAVETFLTDGVGLGYLSRYIVTFDFPGNMVYFRKGRAFGKVDRFDQSGLVIIKTDGQYVVERVDLSSPASDAGIKVGDVIVWIDKEPAARYSLFQLRRLLGEADRQMTLTIRRNRKEGHVNLSPREYRGPLQLKPAQAGKRPP